MWYVIQTFGGEEENTVNIINKLISSDIVQECFVLKREKLKKFHGCWNKVEEMLFHGYTFVISERPEELYEELKKIPKLTKVLGRDEDYFLALSEKEKRVIQKIGNERHRASLSGVICEEGKKIRVLYGPLKNYEGNIVKINLHKREVTVKVEFMGRILELKMGIEMIEMKDKYS